MKNKRRSLVFLSRTIVLPSVFLALLSMTGTGNKTLPTRPQGPCDIYTAAGAPCVAAHSTTRALYASYNGPLYQIMRQSDGKTLDIGVVQPSEGDPGGYANAAAQDSFCANTYCWITKIYDQSGKGNHLVQAPHGGFSGPAMGGFNNLPLADFAPVTLMGHKVYGVFIEPGMGLRWNDAKGTAVDDQAEGQYWVINGNHFNNGCCFDYGNAETDSRDDGDGTMETTYYGNANYWYHGQDAGPWIMTDQENNLVGCVTDSPNDKYCSDLPVIGWRFVTATADGEPHHWRSMGGDAQQGDLHVMFDGPRVSNDRSSYDPMRKQGAILLGNGGDNSNGSQGTFYEGAMTAAGTFPSKETNQKVQANIVAARYDVQQVRIAPANSIDTPPGLQTFSPNSAQNTTVLFVNTTGNSIQDLSLSIVAPKGWKSNVLNTKESIKKFIGTTAPGASVSVTFTVTSGNEPFNGDIQGKASWTVAGNNKLYSETAIEKVRNVYPVKINEYRISDGSIENSTNTFVELYNSSDNTVDLSGWSLTQHQTQLPIFSSVKIPASTKLEPHGFYLFGLSTSGLAVPTKKGESTIYVRTITGMSAGDEIEIGNRSNSEKHKIASVSSPSTNTQQPASPFSRRNAPGTPTTIWQPLPDGPVITIPVGSTNIPVNSVDGFEVGQKMAIGYGASYPTTAQAIEKYEVVTITKVGKPGTQAYLSKDAKVGDRNIKVSSVENISVGDKIRLDIDSKGHGIETVTVKSVGTKSSRNTLDGPLKPGEDPGTGLELEKPLKYNHSCNIPFSVKGTGITFEPATAYSHSSNEPVLPLCFVVKLNEPIVAEHDIDEVVRDSKVTNSGYQGKNTPDQWFGGPALSTSAGNMILRDAAGNVVDGLNYGGLVDPWAAEGFQAFSGAGANGCSAPSPSAGRGFMFFQAQTNQPNKSAGRFPDGNDSDSNCQDFMLQSSTTLAIPSAVGSNNIKVASVADFSIGQKIFIDAAQNAETAIIGTIGTSGGTTAGSAIKAGSNAIAVASVEGFSAGQTITIDNGSNQETAIIASTISGRRRFGRPNNGPTDSIKVTLPIIKAHNTGAPISGSGITLTAPLKKAHESGTQVANNIPTPGEPNQYIRKP